MRILDRVCVCTVLIHSYCYSVYTMYQKSCLMYQILLRTKISAAIFWNSPHAMNEEYITVYSKTPCSVESQGNTKKKRPLNLDFQVTGIFTGKSPFLSTLRFCNIGI